MLIITIALARLAIINDTLEIREARENDALEYFQNHPKNDYQYLKESTFNLTNELYWHQLPLTRIVALKNKKMVGLLELKSPGMMDTGGKVLNSDLILVTYWLYHNNKSEVINMIKAYMGDKLEEKQQLHGDQWILTSDAYKKDRVLVSLNGKIKNVEDAEQVIFLRKLKQMLEKDPYYKFTEHLASHPILSEIHYKEEFQKYVAGLKQVVTQKQEQFIAEGILAMAGPQKPNYDLDAKSVYSVLITVAKTIVKESHINNITAFYKNNSITEVTKDKDDNSLSYPTRTLDKESLKRCLLILLVIDTGPAQKNLNFHGTTNFVQQFISGFPKTEQKTLQELLQEVKEILRNVRSSDDSNLKHPS